MKNITPETSRMLTAAANKVSQLRRELAKAEANLTALIEKAKKECEEVQA